MKMKELFDRGEFAVSAEVGPPKGIHVDELVEEAKTLLPLSFFSASSNRICRFSLGMVSI